MKQIFAIAAILLTLSFTSKKVSHKSTAQVKQIQGCFIFIDSEPLTAYKHLGSVSLTRKESRRELSSLQYQDIRNALLNKVKKLYPQAQGVIYHFHDGDTDQADAIIFD